MSGTIGFVCNYLPGAVPLFNRDTAWGWFLIGVLALLCAQFSTLYSLQSELDKERESHLKPIPTMSLLEVVQRVIGRKNIFGKENKKSMEVLKALCDITEMAKIGSIVVFGRKDWRTVRPSEIFLATRSEIPKSYWDDHCLEYMYFANDARGQTAHKGLIERDEYLDIWFDRRQIDVLWPRKRWWGRRLEDGGQVSRGEHGQDDD